MKNWVGLLNLLRFIPRTITSSTDLICGDIAWDFEGTLIETYFREELNLRSMIPNLLHSEAMQFSLRSFSDWKNKIRSEWHSNENHTSHLQTCLFKNLIHSQIEQGLKHKNKTTVVVEIIGSCLIPNQAISWSLLVSSPRLLTQFSSGYCLSHHLPSEG